MKWTKIIRQARERIGLTPHEVASRVGISDSNYYDIESNDTELSLLYSLHEVFKLFEVLSLSIKEIVKSSGDTPDRFEEPIDVVLADKLRMTSHLEELEDEVGYYLDAESCNPSRALRDWNMDLLEGLCKSFGIDFASAMIAYHELWEKGRIEDE